MDHISSEVARKRLRLRVAAKLMMYAGFAGIVYVFVSALRSGTGEVPSVPSLRVELTDMTPGQAQFLTWEGRPILVYRRTDADVVSLRTPDERLVDPASTQSEQPAFAQNEFRARTAQWFVAIALGTGQGCTVSFLPATEKAFQGKPWAGGFTDSCGKDRYDTAGRVFEKQYASDNLKIPQYSIEASTLILGR